MLALHHMDALWYQILSVPRSISHLEIKHDMPCHDSLWTTSSASDWAHRTLTASQKCPPIRYSEAIRRFLSPLPEPGDTLQLELLGALNVIHFLQSSLREVSGWSAMTGRVTSDRFEVSLGGSPGGGGGGGDKLMPELICIPRPSPHPSPPRNHSSALVHPIRNGYSWKPLGRWQCSKLCHGHPPTWAVSWKSVWTQRWPLREFHWAPCDLPPDVCLTAPV